MYLTPSNILYTHRDPEIYSTTEKAFYEISKSMHSSTVFPKLQVVKKGGFYFTLNDAKLHVYRRLEKLGRCSSVEVEKVSLKEVPEGIRNLMTAPDNVPRYKVHKAKDKRQRGKYESITTFTSTNINTDESLVFTKCSEDTDNDEKKSDVSDNSETEHGASGSDWTDEDISETDIESSEEHTVDEDDESSSNENERFI
ncbi:uncharacterized protein LOC123562532 [Mercenaria mercenaria]|uniref:uncharacterized protein LOC123562532 n=1 Tax=Mercenaria mercenaria TaxID=6596 RepID=UPI00234F134D|nr:uncharacterized protein LOC123562532 [Mercenaria mercenaria]